MVRCWILEDMAILLMTTQQLPGKDQICQHPRMDGRGAQEAPALTEELLSTEGCQGDGGREGFCLFEDVVAIRLLIGQVGSPKAMCLQTALAGLGRGSERRRSGVRGEV